MTDDIRCCGTGTCIINDDGFCWCGQQWDGEKMCFPNPRQTPRADDLSEHAQESEQSP